VERRVILAMLAAAGAVDLSLVDEDAVAPGITVRSYRVSAPSPDAYVAAVDLCEPGIALDATRLADAGQSTGAWGAERGVALAVNGDFYRSATRVYGDAAGDGVPWPLENTGRDEQYSYEWFFENFGWIALLQDEVTFTHTAQVKSEGAATSTSDVADLPARPAHCEGGDPCGVIPRLGGIVDDDDACARRFGPGAYWREEAAGHGGGLSWTNAFESDLPSNWAWWRLELERAGRYEVEIWAEPGFNVWAQAAYTVRAAGESHAITLDLAAADGWRSLGDFDFDAGGAQWVALVDNHDADVPDDQHLPFDALRLTRLDPHDSGLDSDAPAPADSGPGGDSAPGADGGDGGDGGGPDGGPTGGGAIEERVPLPDEARGCGCGGGATGAWWWLAAALA